jgi:hypothetical protein
MEAKENSGSLTLTTSVEKGTQIAVVWEWKKEGTIKVRARPLGESIGGLADVREAFEQAMTRCRARATERIYRRTFLYYKGLPWLGEVWLDDFTRLGPPQRQYEVALLGPRVVFLDALVECVGPGDDAAFKRLSREVELFLSVVIGAHVEQRQGRKEWTWRTAEPECKVRRVEYIESDYPVSMPAKGAAPPVPLAVVTRPDFTRRGIGPEITERWLPADVCELWTKLHALPAEKRRDFLHSAAKWQEAVLHWQDRKTLSFALMVVACESLKPATADHRQNIYDVVEALLGKPKANALKQATIPPENVRNAHLHRGICRSSEVVFDLLVSTFDDVAFDEAHDEMWYTTKAAIIEWLRRDGVISLRPMKRSST